MNETTFQNARYGDQLRLSGWGSHLKYAALLFLFGTLTILCWAVPIASGQQTPVLLNEPLQLENRVIPLQGVTPETVQTQVAAGTTVPMWRSFTVFQGKTYQFFMVGRPPQIASTNQTTTVKAPIVNVAFQFADGTVLDPTATDPTCSP